MTAMFCFYMRVITHDCYSCMTAMFYFLFGSVHSTIIFFSLT